jgi:hypothetical protein
VKIFVKIFTKIFVIFVIFVTFRKLFSRKAKINFREIFATFSRKYENENFRFNPSYNIEIEGSQFL